MKTSSRQDLIDLVDGAAIFSAEGGGPSLEEGYRIVEDLSAQGISVKMVDPLEVLEGARVVNFACVGATADVFEFKAKN